MTRQTSTRQTSNRAMPRPPTIPATYAKAIAWCRTRAPRWAANRALLHLSEAEVQQMQALTDAAVQSRANLERIRAEYRAAALTSRADVAAMRAHAGGLLARIRALAGTSATPAAIYSAAQVRPPEKRSPTPAPATPWRFRVTLTPATGALRLAFACNHPRGVRGVTYRVDRAVFDGTAHTDFAPLTIAKERAFTDTRIPTGAVVVIYRVTAQTSTRDGGVAIHMVRLSSQDVVLASPLPARGNRAA